MFRILFIPTPHSRAIVLLSTQLYSQKQKSQEAKLLIYETCESLAFKNAKRTTFQPPTNNTHDCFKGLS